MDDEHISPTLIAAGNDYLVGLKKLGFLPQGMLWAKAAAIDANGVFEVVHDDWRLVIFTAVIDLSGPLALTELIFKAYQRSALPRTISPFIVEVISTQSPFFREILDAVAAAEQDTFPAPIPSSPSIIMQDNPLTAVLARDLWVSGKWVYFVDRQLPKIKERAREWKNFQMNVESLAA